MKTFSIAEVVDRLSHDPLTAVVVNRDGKVVELVSVPQKLTPEFTLQFGEQRKGCVFRFVAGRRYTPEEISKLVPESKETFALLDSGKLQPGTNCF